MAQAREEEVYDVRGSRCSCGGGDARKRMKVSMVLKQEKEARASEVVSRWSMLRKR